MQLHYSPGAIDAAAIGGYLNTGGGNGPFYVLSIGALVLFIQSPEEADALIAAVAEAKRLLAPLVRECGTEWADEHGEGCPPEDSDEDGPMDDEAELRRADDAAGAAR